MYNYNFKLKKNDKNIGTVYLPNENSTNLPVIVYCHGWKGCRQLWTPTEKLCEFAMQNNIALVTFDFYGCGETGGDYSEMTYNRWKENLIDIIDYIKEQTFSDNNKIGCYAFSSGSVAAFRLAAETDVIKFIISVGTCITSNIFMGSGSPAKWLSDNIETLYHGGKIKDFGIEFCTDVVSNAPVHMVKDILCPVLFLQGTADNVFRITDAKIGYEIMKSNGRDATHIEIENGTHELENVFELAMEHIYRWLLPILY